MSTQDYPGIVNAGMVDDPPYERSGPKARIWAEIEFLASGLAAGESSRGICPKCLGGSSGERSFLCSRDSRGIAYFICFRATCGYRGQIDVLLGPKGDQEPRKRKTHRFNRPVESLTEAQIKWYRAKFDINPGVEVYWCPTMERFAHRVYGPLGQHRGWLLRDYVSDLHPKALAYPEKEDENWIGWFNPSEINQDDSFTPVVVVEDLVSARKVADAGYRSVSILGTHNFDFDVIYEIRAETDSIVLALDRGTLPLMLKYRSKYELLFDDIIIWQLDQDLKYVSRKRIREAMEDGKPDFVSYPDGR